MRSLQTGLPLTSHDIINIREMFNEESRNKLGEVMEYIRRNYPEVIKWMEERGLKNPCCVLSKDSIIDILLDITLSDSDELYYEIEKIKIERNRETIEMPIIHVWIATVGEDKLIIVFPDQVIGLMF